MLAAVGREFQESDLEIAKGEKALLKTHFGNFFHRFGYELRQERSVISWNGHVFSFIAEIMGLVFLLALGRHSNSSGEDIGTAKSVAIIVTFFHGAGENGAVHVGNGDA